MTVDDTRLRAAYARVMAERDQRGAADDVPLDDILALVERAGPEAARLRTLDRVMASDRARREFELLRAAAESAPRARAMPRFAAALAASLLVATVGGTWLATRDRPDVMRGADALELVAPDESPAPSDTLRFVWRAVPGAVRYDLEILDAAGAVAHSARAADTAYAVAAASLPRGADLQWMVRAERGDGTEVLSPARRLRTPTAR